MIPIPIVNLLFMLFKINSALRVLKILFSRISIWLAHGFFNHGKYFLQFDFRQSLFHRQSKVRSQHWLNTTTKRNEHRDCCVLRSAKVSTSLWKISANKCSFEKSIDLRAECTVTTGWFFYQPFVGRPPSLWDFSNRSHTYSCRWSE